MGNDCPRPSLRTDERRGGAFAGAAWSAALAACLFLVPAAGQAAKPAPPPPPGPVPAGTIYYWQGRVGGSDMFRMLGDGSAKTYMPCPSIDSGEEWNPPCDGSLHVPSRLLHGGQRWFLSRHQVPDESDPFEGGGRRVDYFAISEAGANVRLTDDPQLRLIGERATWASDESATSATISFLAARWASDGSVVPGSGGLYTGVVLFDEAGDVLGLAAPGPTFLVSLGLAQGQEEWEIPNSATHDWSPDMSRIVTDAQDDPNFSYYPYTGDTIRVVEVATGAATILAQGCGPGASLYAPAWSPDGTRIAFNALGCGDYTIDVMNADGSSRTSVVSETQGGRPEFPRWSPDSAHLVYGRYQPATRKAPEAWDVYRVTLGSNARLNLTADVSARCYSPDWR